MHGDLTDVESALRHVDSDHVDFSLLASCLQVVLYKFAMANLAEVLANEFFTGCLHYV